MGQSGVRYILSHKTYEDAQRVERNIEIDTATGESIEFVERQTARFLAEVIALIQKSGFDRPQCFSDLEGSPADESRFRVFTCRRP